MGCMDNHILVRGSSTMLKELLPAQVKQIQNTELTVYSVPLCLGCQQLKDILKEKNIPFKEFDMSTPEGLTELRFNQCFAMQAPVLQVGKNFFQYKQLFHGNLEENILKALQSKQEKEYLKVYKTYECIDCKRQLGESWAERSINLYGCVICDTCIQECINDGTITQRLNAL